MMPAPKGNTNARGNRGGGRRTLYKREYAQMARSIALLGATDADLADVFDVSESTIGAWKRAHVEFSAALKKGKTLADAQVATRLYRRALGYSHKAVKINLHAGEAVITPYTERYPPDTTAAIFWLKNRRPNEWRDRQPEGVTDVADTARAIREALKQMADADGLDDAAA